MAGGSVFQRVEVSNITRLRPTPGKIYVKRIAQSRTAHGIILVGKPTDKLRYEHTEAEVVAVGPGMVEEIPYGDPQGSPPKCPVKRVLVQPQVRVGERVIISKFAGFDIVTEDHQEYVILVDADILAVIERA